MLGRYRKLIFGTLCDDESSQGCVLLRSTPVHQSLMDPISDYTGPAVSHYAQSTSNQGGSGGSIAVQKHFEKSESEDSGVELLSPSPFGSESSYNPDESESLESSTPEDPDNLDSPTPEDIESPKSTTFENQNSLTQSEETVLLEASALENAGSFKIHEDKDADTIDTLEHFFTQQRERDLSGVPHKLEQAILRSRRQRSCSRESIQHRTARHNRQVGSLKDQRRGKSSYQLKSPTRQSQENKDHDPLLLPGDGLRYLDSLCQMLEQIAELQQRNQRLQQEKREAEGRVQSQVLFLDSCVCGASSASRDSDNDLTDSRHHNESTWEPKHYRKRSSSHAGVLLSMARPADNGLRQPNKLDPRYVSVPNLKEEESRPYRNYKTEASQWYKVKEMLSRLTRKGAGPIFGPGPAVETRNNCRTQTLLEENAQRPRRQFLPGLVIRPHNHGRQFH